MRAGAHAGGSRGLPPEIELRHLILGHLEAQVVATAARLGVADELSGGPRSSRELAAATGSDPDAFDRFMRAAASLGLFEEPEPGTFGLGRLGALLGSAPPTLRSLAIALTAPAHWRSIERLGESVRSGGAVAPGVLGAGLWDYFAANPGEGEHFAAAMSEITGAVADEVARAFPETGHRLVVDVGGSRGTLLARLLADRPGARGILFDRPGVAGVASELGPVASRIEVVEGDFFDAVPQGGDLYLLKHILHDWDDERAGRIVANCRRAARPGATLLVVERVLGAGADPLAYLADILMHVMFGGRERTEDEFGELLSKAGFRLEAVTPLSLYALLRARFV